jgi:ketosteroid isomerase-like protein
MSHENVEIVRKSLDRWNETGEPIWELLDPDIEYVIDLPAWLAGTYRGQGSSSRCGLGTYNRGAVGP